MATGPKEVCGKPAQEARAAIEEQFGKQDSIDDSHIRSLPRPVKVKLASAVSTYCKTFPDSEVERLRNGCLTDDDRRKIVARFLMASMDGRLSAKTPHQ